MFVLIEVCSLSITDSLAFEIRKAINELSPANQVSPTHKEVVYNPKDRVKIKNCQACIRLK